MSGKRKYTKNYKIRKKTNGHDSIILYISIFFAAGVLLGAIYASLVSSTVLQPLYSHADSIINGIGLIGLNKGNIFIESLFKHGKTALLIWIVSFIPYGGLMGLIILGIKGTSLGFSSALLIRYYNLRGLWYAAVLYLPQTLIIITSCFLLIYFCIKLNQKNNTKASIGNNNYFVEKLLYLLVALAGIAMGSFFEAYISPGLILVLL